ncbi:dihydrofolate synthase/folylpolyglutamate synthase [Alicyclobacillus sacchari]|uniref:tetrahydrofolate synthase n=1 Tax=Alicyclobacillus sacchari TaxID=392010 RepID=A0A4R8LPR0_9BACL|nr:dihydrofolate synthase/folylpolyglutamate synthase [Alicyclobacillus sacchari]
MNIAEACAWIGSLRRFGIKPGLERVRHALSNLGNPERNLRFYHVAGTNGKGSVCQMLATLLTASGRRTGLYTSPGLGGFNGRMSIDGEPISEGALAEYATRVRSATESQMQDPLTEFEILTIISLLYFRDAGVEAVVWETGLGGRYDATNVVQPVVTAITNVTYDHVEILGPTIVDIASDKAGIIKPGIPVVTAAVDDAYRVIERVAKSQRAPLIRIGCDAVFATTGTQGSGQLGTYRGLFRDAAGVKLGLFGEHQAQNAGVALAMYELGEGRIAENKWHKALDSLASVRWPLRFEVFRDGHRPIVIDGAHNPDAALQLSKSLTKFGRSLAPCGWNMVVGVFADKDVRQMLPHVLPLAAQVIVCKPDHPRGAEPHVIAEEMRKLRPELRLTVEPEIDAAVRKALQTDSLPIAIWGNLHMAEAARKTITTLGLDYWM